MLFFFTLEGSAIGGSVADVCFALSCSTESLVGCSEMSTTTGATSGIEVEAVGCSELVAKFTSRLRTSDCRPCSSSESSRSTIGTCVCGAKLVG